MSARPAYSAPIDPNRKPNTATAIAPAASIAVATLKTPNRPTNAVEASAPMTPPRFNSTPHHAAVCGLNPDLAAIKGVQLFKRYATKSKQKIANEAIKVMAERPSVNSAKTELRESLG